MTKPTHEASKPTAAQPSAAPPGAPAQQDLGVQALADPNGSSSAADKEYFRRKNHGGTGA